MTSDTAPTAEQVIGDFIQEVMVNPPVKENIAFRMARVLLAFGGEPMAYSELVIRYCQQTGTDYEEFMSDFALAWPIINHPVKFSTNTLEEAYHAAQKEPIPFPEGTPKRTSPVIDALYSMAWYLSVEACPDPFFLPRKRIGELMGVSSMKIFRAVTWLERYGFVTCVDKRYSFKRKRRCKKYRMGDRNTNLCYIRTEADRRSERLMKKPFGKKPIEIPAGVTDEQIDRIVESIINEQNGTFSF